MCRCLGSLVQTKLDKGKGLCQMPSGENCTLQNNWNCPGKDWEEWCSKWEICAKAWRWDSMFYSGSWKQSLCQGHSLEGQTGKTCDPHLWPAVSRSLRTSSSALEMLGCCSVGPKRIKIEEYRGAAIFVFQQIILSTVWRIVQNNTEERNTWGLCEREWIMVLPYHWE